MFVSNNNRNMKTEYKAIYLRKNTVIDKIILQLVYAYNELKTLNEITDNETIDISNSVIKELNDKRLSRKAVLTVKVETLSALLTQ